MLAVRRPSYPLNSDARALFAPSQAVYTRSALGHPYYGIRLLEPFLVSTTAVALGEIGDKTQFATAVLAARFDSLAAVVVGTTLGMLIADVPVVFAGQLAADRIPFKVVRTAAAALFAALGVWVLIAGVPS